MQSTENNSKLRKDQTSLSIEMLLIHLLMVEKGEMCVCVCTRVRLLEEGDTDHKLMNIKFFSPVEILIHFT